MLDKMQNLCYNNNVPKRYGNFKPKGGKRYFMANKITQAQKLEMAKGNVIALLTEMLENASAERVGDYTYAVPTEVAGAEVWVEIDLTAKTTMTTEEGKVPYDPFEKAAVWEAEKEIKRQNAEERARKKAETLRKAEEKKAKAKAQALAKKNAREKALAENADKTE